MANLIELDTKDIVEDGVKKAEPVLQVLVYLIVTVFFLVLWVFASMWTVRGVDYLSDAYDTTVTNYKYRLYDYLGIQDVYEINSDGVQVTGNLNSIIETYSAKYGMNPAIPKALIEQESGFKTDRIRFEPKWKEQYSRKFPKPKHMNDIEYNLYFSSIGIMQVGYILHKETCGLNSYTDLLFADKNIDCALKILSLCLENSRNIKSPSQRLRTCIKSYNGSGPAADQYTESVMSKIEDYLIGNAKTDLLVVDSTSKIIN